MSLKVLIFASLVIFVIAEKRRNEIRIESAQNVDCLNDPERRETSPNDCNFYFGCDEFDELVEFACPDEFPVFDSNRLECVIEEGSFCYLDELPEWPEVEDGECPRDGNELVFIPGEYCDEYYICLNGEPNLMTCRNGEHWNDAMNYCDHPHLAGCDENAEHPSTLPECAPNVLESFPHPQNCNWFIHCDRGNRFIQQCQHLFHFDVDQKRCLFRSIAKCITD